MMPTREDDWRGHYHHIGELRKSVASGMLTGYGDPEVTFGSEEVEELRRQRKRVEVLHSRVCLPIYELDASDQEDVVEFHQQIIDIATQTVMDRRHSDVPGKGQEGIVSDDFILGLMFGAATALSVDYVFDGRTVA